MTTLMCYEDSICTKELIKSIRITHNSQVNHIEISFYLSSVTNAIALSLLHIKHTNKHNHQQIKDARLFFKKQFSFLNL